MVENVTVLALDYGTMTTVEKRSLCSLDAQSNTNIYARYQLNLDSMIYRTR